MRNSNFSQFFSQISTKDELLLFQSSVHEVESRLFSTKENPREVIYQIFSEPIVKSIVEAADAAGVNLDDPSQVARFLSEAAKTLKDVPVLSISLAFDPSAKQTRRISEWFLARLGRNVVFDISLVPEIMGGIIIEYEGVRHDFSLAKKVTEFIETK